jgi:hypothetical protein
MDYEGTDEDFLSQQGIGNESAVLLGQPAADKPGGGHKTQRFEY